MKIDPLDKLFSEYIRKRAIKTAGGCERCLSWKENYKGLQCCHFISRSRRSVRWDEDNAVGLCCGCHRYMDGHHHEFVEWFKARLGDKYDLLLSRERITHPKPDKKALKLYYRSKIKELES